MSLKNFLPLRREVMEHWIYKDSDYFKVWVDMLFRARFLEEPKKDIYEGSLYTLNQGEFLYSRPKWSLRLNVKEHKLKKLTKLLTDEEMLIKVGRVGKSGATIYSIKNYKKYNNYTNETPALSVENTDVEGNSSQPNDNQRPTKDQRKTSERPLKNNVKKEKKEKKVFIPPTFTEVEAYVLDKKYVVDPKFFIDYFEANDWVNANGKPVASWKGTVVTWNKNELRKNPNSKPYKPKPKKLPRRDDY